MYCNKLLSEMKYLENVQRSVRAKQKEIDVRCTLLDSNNIELREIIFLIHGKMNTLLMERKENVEKLKNMMKVVVAKRKELIASLSEIRAAKRSERAVLKEETRSLQECCEKIERRIRGRGRQISRKEKAESNQVRMVVSSWDLLDSLAQGRRTPAELSAANRPRALKSYYTSRSKSTTKVPSTKH
eukprot:TRINITY_DN10450_c0_g1_i2.p1 TRINITY_DN10450_c0_g1~~TRINITY_DN10450_c0_g1_i2.p1  ORF type:complete len:186 (+),score=26.60 TRINITY_DN10450_c0_g1_i2:152-709(+)